MEEEQGRVAEFYKCAAREKKLRARIAEATSTKTRKAAQAVYWNSSAVRKVAGVKANGSLAKTKQLDLRSLYKVLDQSNIHNVSSEVVLVYPKIKSNGKSYRALHKFGIENKTYQYVLREALRPMFKPRSYQCEYQKDGLIGAMARIRALGNSGFDRFSRLDIKEFFQNLDLELVMPLAGIPQQLVEDHIMAKEVNRQISIHNPLIEDDALLHEARRGPPQGSAVSSLVAAKFVAKLDLKPNASISNWADDFLLLGKSDEEVKQLEHALIDKIASNSGGKLDVIVKESGHLSDGAHFLGHYIKKVDGKIMITVASDQELYAGLDEYKMKISSLIWTQNAAAPAVQNRLRKLVLDMAVFGKSWCNAFRACDDIAQFRQHVDIEIADLMTSVGLSDSDLASYSNPAAEWDDPYGISAAK